MRKNEAVLVSEETPEDIATLYSWANMQGAKYRDFSAARARVREMARQRVQEAMDAERNRSREALPGDVPASSVEGRGAKVASQPAVTSGIATEAPLNVAATHAPDLAATPLPMLMTPTRSANKISPLPPHSGMTPAISTAAVMEGVTVDALDGAAIGAASAGVTVPGPGYSASQWFALQGILGGPAQAFGKERSVAHGAARAPVLAVFSLAGGVGKSCLVATLGRMLSAHGERVLLVDTAAFSTLQFFFGSHDQRVGVLRTFTRPDASLGAPVDLLTLDIDGMKAGNNPSEALTQEIQRNARLSNRVLIDLATASGATVRRILRMSPMVLIPVTPDVRSVASVSAIESFFQRNPSGMGPNIQPLYVLNQYDEGRQLHRDVRAMLENQLGERLVPFVLHRGPMVSEALAEGMTVVDYAPGSQVAKDYEALAEWVRAQVAPMEHVYSGVRWSEQ